MENRASPGGAANSRPAPPWLRPLLPREHGAWAMLIAPMALAIGLTGCSVLQLALAIAVLLGYLAAAALLEWIRTHRSRRRSAQLIWVGAYALVGGAVATPALLHRPAVLWIGLCASAALPVDLIFLRMGRERALINGLVSIPALTSAGLASYLLGRGALDARAWQMWLMCLLLFVGSLLFVKSMIRERNNTAAWLISISYHLAAVIGTILLVRPAIAMPYTFALLRAATLARRKLRPAHLGIVELLNSLWFLIAALWALRGS